MKGHKHDSEKLKNDLLLILTLHAFGVENRLKAKDITRLYNATHDDKASELCISATLKKTPRVGYKSGVDGGYFVITTRHEALGVVDDLRRRAGAMLEKADAISRLYGILTDKPATD